MEKIANTKYLLEEIIGHDIILLTETHLGKDENIVPHGYKYYPVRRPRSANNRCFGSLDIFIKVTIYLFYTIQYINIRLEYITK
jgi:hypothetical protein